MLASLSSVRALRLAAVVALPLVLAACAATPPGAELGAGGVAGSATPGSAQDFTVNVGDRVFFETDQSTLTTTAQATLDLQAQWLARYPRYAVLIEGHADERGTREYNFSLGARRAQAVRDYLAARGVDTGRIRTVSYGKERPAAACSDASCQSQNRRAVTVLEGGAGA
ncbi:peptidoglycan-associated lipoprotein Pal [Salinarimonas rosea]|uniref:peptidoglycan-associated lipoprotein Pal n=1 Tax=Salinarimonas rosea TaxID=552063 RepID=UPI000405D582|nr:peptidoglycan-associated lipoprotein Pal [Salinarimonas rosea]